MAVSMSSALHAATRDIITAAQHPDPLHQVKKVLSDYADRFHASGALIHEEEDDEVLLHASPKLTIYHITLSPGLQYPPHNHLMDALIGIYRGGETNFIYPAAAGKLDRPLRQDVTAPAVLHMPRHIVHSVANTGHARSGALHVYLGDLTEIHRHMWTSESGGPEPFDNVRYLTGARPIRQIGAK
jgi:predicted metal-dependent enzyme (double-stranded beta helix superfamily)